MRTLSSVANVTVLTPELKTSLYSGHLNLAQWYPDKGGSTVCIHNIVVMTDCESISHMSIHPMKRLIIYYTCSMLTSSFNGVRLVGRGDVGGSGGFVTDSGSGYDIGVESVHHYCTRIACWPLF